MNHIKLTNHHYVNPANVVYIEFIPPERYCPEALLDVYFTPDKLDTIRFKGAEAEEALKNWSAAHERSMLDKQVIAVPEARLSV